MHEESIDAYSDEDVSVFVVWQGMFSADSESKAREASTIMAMHRVFQFWDPRMSSAVSYAKETHPTYAQEIAEALPENHVLKSAWMSRREIAPERMPMWNYAAFYPAGVRWEDSPPRPAGLIKLLVVSTGAFDPDDPHVYFVDNFANPPILSNWHDLTEKQMERLMTDSEE